VNWHAIYPTSRSTIDRNLGEKIFVKILPCFFHWHKYPEENPSLIFRGGCWVVLSEKIAPGLAVDTISGNEIVRWGLTAVFEVQSNFAIMFLFNNGKTFPKVESLLLHEFG
jgi:hypothetical protein